MATLRNDFIVLQTSDPAIVSGGRGDDTYILSATTLAGRTTPLTLIDIEGANSLQLVAGLRITASAVAADALQLTLGNGAVIDVLGARAFTYEPGGNSIAGIDAPDLDYATFVTTVLGTTVPTGTNISTGGPVTIGGGGGAVMVTAGNVTPHDASTADLRFQIAPGDYTYTIDGFGAGDVLDFPDGNLPTVVNASYTDNALEVRWAGGGLAVIRLVGLPAGLDGQLNTLAHLNTVFGVGTVV